MIETMPNLTLFHILLSTLTFTVLCIAALQALSLAFQEYLLRHKRATGFINLLPPLETMEVWLFRIITIGFILLTIVLITSLWSFHPIWVSPLWQKTLLSLFAWLVFAGLLSGRCILGWRGWLAVRWTLCGVCLVIVTFFGSELL